MKINISNAGKINAAITAAEGRASARCMDAELVQAMIASFESQFPAPKTAQVGLTVEVVVGFGGRVPSSYRGTPESTRATVQRCASGWFLTGVDRSIAPAGDDRVTIIGGRTEELEQAILKRALESVYH